MSAFVLNLKRRSDRLERFQKFYSEHGPNLPLRVFEAIDGASDFHKVPSKLSNSILNINDYDNKSSIRATAYSHMMIWSEIIDGEEDYALVFEDDCYFRPDNKRLPAISSGSMKNKWSQIIADYSKELEKPKSLLYFGVGDLLPIHTVPPSESMLISQESNHVIAAHQTGKFYGRPNFKSPYVFSWLGLGGYCISKIQAKYLLAIANKYPMNCAIDAWIKKLYEKEIVDIYLTIPLFCYFPNILDSDTARPELRPA